MQASEKQLSLAPPTWEDEPLWQVDENGSADVRGPEMQDVEILRILDLPSKDEEIKRKLVAASHARVPDQGATATTADEEQPTSPRPPKVRPATVTYVSGINTPNEHTEEPLGERTREDNLLVAAELATHDADMEERVRQNILDGAVKAEVVSANRCSGDKRCLWIGCALLLLFVVGIIIVGILVLDIDNGNANVDESPPSPISPPSTPTSAPSSAPQVLSAKEQQVAAALLPVFDVSNLTNSQQAAYDWLTDNDEFEISDDAQLLERFTIVLLYLATEGNSWLDTLGFLKADEHQCDWRSPSSQAIQCDENLRVLEINIVENELKGTVPSELQHLVHLKKLNLGTNLLTGSIPTEFGKLAALSDLRLHGNTLHGEMPSSLFELPGLSHLELQSNHFTGNIPDTVGSALRLELFYAYNNDLSGVIPTSINELAKLKYFQIQFNKGLRGDIPTFRSSRNLNLLDLSACSFSGTIPTELFENQKLTTLALHENNLGGQAPTEIAKLGSLQGLWLYNNVLTGPFPFFNLTPSLVHLHIEENVFTGSVDGLMNGNLFPNLESLTIFTNTFSSTIPAAGLANFTKLQDLHFGTNEITGTLPTEMGLLTNLRGLSMGLNGCSGPVPSEIGQLTQLASLDVCCNEFAGTLPGAWSQLTDLKELWVESNAFTGSVPTSWNTTSFGTLEVFALHDNALNGSLSEAFCTHDGGLLGDFSADCRGPDALIDCSCCTTCCKNFDCEES